ncbi:hypothetical protein TRL7639_00808 [Falsiruegeria litorea R37]|uniref:Uncharacterized protein n=1 Tax=Falsiruegeria litorea R37 TaxID=1200284 RepID=A0A1Y5RSW6_9RHOB|nr:hypothetical protein TRL7639_00808 [Falsiruegeria litorea R37]
MAKVLLVQMQAHASRGYNKHNTFCDEPGGLIWNEGLTTRLSYASSLNMPDLRCIPI